MLLFSYQEINDDRLCRGAVNKYVWEVRLNAENVWQLT